MERRCSVLRFSDQDEELSFSVWNSDRINELSFKERKELKNIIDEMGVRSAEAQKLKAPVTDFRRLLSNDHQLYLCTIPNHFASGIVFVVALLKTGIKKLYVTRPDGQYFQISPLCVLDFYVHENFQRTGIGHKLFEAMLLNENKKAHELGYDRPSIKLMNFLSKHYHLTAFLPQANQFVVFERYFDNIDSFMKVQATNHENEARRERSHYSGSCSKRSHTNDPTASSDRERNQIPQNSIAFADKRTWNADNCKSAITPSKSTENELKEDDSLLQQIKGSKTLIRCHNTERRHRNTLEIEFWEDNDKAEQTTLQMMKRLAVSRKVYRNKQMSGSGVADALVWSTGIMN